MIGIWPGYSEVRLCLARAFHILSWQKGAKAAMLNSNDSTANFITVISVVGTTDANMEAQCSLMAMTAIPLGVSDFRCRISKITTIAAGRRIVGHRISLLDMNGSHQSDISDSPSGLETEEAPTTETTYPELSDGNNLKEASRRCSAISLSDILPHDRRQSSNKGL